MLTLPETYCTPMQLRGDSASGTLATLAESDLHGDTPQIGRGPVQASPDPQPGKKGRPRWFVMRWRLEVTFREVRTHLGVETQRQWSDWAIARTTPALLGLFSPVTLLAHCSTRRGKLPIRQTAWYDKPLPTFSDALAIVRYQLWQAMIFQSNCPFWAWI